MHFPPRIYNLLSSYLRRLLSHIRILLIKGLSKLLSNYVNSIESEVYIFFNNLKLVIDANESLTEGSSYNESIGVETV